MRLTTDTLETAQKAIMGTLVAYSTAILIASFVAYRSLELGDLSPRAREFIQDPFRVAVQDPAVLLDQTVLLVVTPSALLLGGLAALWYLLETIRRRRQLLESEH